MEHVAIDLGGQDSQICVRSSDGTVLEERRCPTILLSEYLRARPQSRVVVETCSEAFRVADAAVEAGHEVRVVSATLVRSLGVGARRTKTDRRDARALSEVSCRIELPSVHIPSASSRERKALCSMRDALVRARTQVSNGVRGWLRTQGVRLRSGSVDTLPARVRAQVRNVPSYVTRQLDTLDALTRSLVAADHDVRYAAKTDPTCRRLMSVPGVGANTALRFVTALDEIGRFPNAHKVEAYLGLTPGERSSSQKQHRTGITKAGSPAVRHTLVQAAWAARRCRRQDPLHHWATAVQKRRGKRVAAVALARKLAGILYAIWRDGTCYEPAPGRAAMR